MIDRADLERACAERDAEVEKRMAAMTSWFTDEQRKPMTYEEAVEAEMAYLMAKMMLAEPCEPGPPVLTVIDGGKE